MTGIVIFETAVIPFLLNNSSCWFSMKKSDLERLNRFQNRFLSNLLKVQKSPSCSLHWEFTMLKMENRILKAKLLLRHHLETLPESAVAHQVLQMQKKQGLPTLCSETDHFLREHNISDINKYTKLQWKKFVGNLIAEENKNQLLSEMSQCKKIYNTEIMCESYEVKSYLKDMKPYFARVNYRERYSMLEFCKLNFPSQPEYLRQGFKCYFCSTDVKTT